MEIALGISMTTATARMVLVEGDKADGLTVECDQFCLSAPGEAVTASASEQVSGAILATQQNASRQGHNISVCGIAMSDDCDPDELRESLAARGLGDVIMVGESQAAAALAHTVARAVGYTETALLFVNERAATLSVVDSAKRSVVEEISRDLQSADVCYVLKEMLESFSAEGPQGLFVVDSSGRLPVIKACLEAATSLPIIFPEESEWALARGAALSAAAAPRFEASTLSLAYAKDPDEEEFAGAAEDATGPLAPADEVTRRALFDVIRWGTTENLDEGDGASSSRFLPIGSLAASVVVIGVVAVVMAFAASTTPTSTDHLFERGQILPTEPHPTATPAPPAIYNAAPAPNPAPPPDLPPPAAPPPTAVAMQQAPRTITVQAPAADPQMVQPVAAAQAPVAPKPVAAAPVEPAPQAAPDPVDPPPAPAPVPLVAPAPQVPAFTPPAPAVQLPPLLPKITLGPPVSQAPAAAPQAPFLRWLPSFLRPQQQAPQWQPPAQQYTPPAQDWEPPAQQYTPPVQQWEPPAQQYTPPVQQWEPPVQQYTPPAQHWTPPVQEAPIRPQSPSYTGGFDGGSRGGRGGGVPFWPFG